MIGLDQRRYAPGLRLVLADDDPLAAAFVAQLLAPATDLQVVATARTAGELRGTLEAEQPDMLVTELNLRGESVLPLLREIQDQPHPPRIAVLTAERGDEQVLGAIAAGVVGYLLKDRAFAGLPEALRAIGSGGSVIDERLIQTVLNGYRELTNGISRRGQIEPDLPASTLSGRAMAVLEMMAAGLRNREIAERLGLSEHTVKVYVGQVLAHLGVSDRTSAVMQAIRRGLVRAPVRDLRPAQ